jgi:hypothetical protein
MFEDVVFPKIAFKTLRKAQNEYLRLTRDFYIHQDICKTVMRFEDLFDQGTYDIIKRESTVNLIHSDLEFPGYDESLDDRHSKPWKTAWSGLPTNLQFKLLKKFTVLPYQVIEIEVEL